ncbi:MAG: ABC transporter permease [Chloroflexi bacterium]|nr:ABC transporter permease [Chloroflexota bacterium]
MLAYLARRLLWSLAVLAVVGFLTFTLTYVLPADPARALAGIRASPEDVARISRALGLDQPFHVQLGTYAGNVLSGDFGHSYKLDRDVLPLLLERFPATLQLALAGVFVELLIGIPLGVMAATRRGSRFDSLARLFSIIAVSAPPFLVGYVLLNLLAFQPQVRFDLELFAIGGYEPLSLRHLFLPALTLGLSGLAYHFRLMRASLLEELRRGYVNTARAKGAHERTVIWGHALRNAIPPVLTQIGLDLGFFLGGVVVIEAVFSWPGIGQLAVNSIATADIPLILGTVLFGTLTIVAANLVVDLAYVWVDPRVRMGARGR